MKICIFTRTFDQNIGGVESHTLSLVLKLMKLGYKITIVTNKAKNPINIKGLEVIRIGTFKNRYTLKFLLEVRSFFQKNKKKFDLFINVGVSIALISKKSTQNNIISIIHGSYITESITYWDLLIISKNPINILIIIYCFLMYFLLEKPTLQLSSKIITVSEYLYRKTLFFYKKIENKVIFINNGVEIPNILNKNFHKKSFNFFYIGRLHYTKGIRFILKFLDKYKNDLSPFIGKFVFYGDGEERRLVEEYSKKIDFIYYGGILNLKNKYIKMQEYDFMISPVLTNETFGLTVIEAMASGVIPIVSEYEAINYIVKDGYNGFIFKKGDDYSLLGIFKRIFEFDLSKIRYNGYHTVKSKFNEKDMCNKYIKIINNYKK